jgi:hypothetical protein
MGRRVSSCPRHLGGFYPSVSYRTVVRSRPKVRLTGANGIFADIDAVRNAIDRLSHGVESRVGRLIVGWHELGCNAQDLPGLGSAILGQGQYFLEEEGHLGVCTHLEHGRIRGGVYGGDLGELSGSEKSFIAGGPRAYRCASEAARKNHCERDMHCDVVTVLGRSAKVHDIWRRKCSSGIWGDSVRDRKDETCRTDSMPAIWLDTALYLHTWYGGSELKCTAERVCMGASFNLTTASTEYYSSAAVTPIPPHILSSKPTRLRIGPRSACRSEGRHDRTDKPMMLTASDPAHNYGTPWIRSS